MAESGTPFLDLAANQVEFAQALRDATAPAFEAIGLKLEAVTVQNVSLPEELQKILDQKIGMGMVGGDMGKFMQYQTAQSMPKFAEGVGPGQRHRRRRDGPRRRRRARPGDGATSCRQGLQGAGAPEGTAAAPAGVRPDEVMATIEKLADLKAKGILTAEEFDAKKAELLKKLV